MSRKNSRRKSKVVITKKPEPESSSEEEEEVKEVDLEAMEKMLNNEESNNKASSDEENSDGSSDDDSDGYGEEEDIGLELSNNEELEGSESQDDEEQHRDNNTNNPVSGDENCTLDLRNLLAINSFQVNYKDLFSANSTSTNKKDEGETATTTIHVVGAKQANEEYLLEKATEGCSQLLSGLWKLETEKTSVGPLATLPSYFEYKTPRELPPPPPRTETKWEKFAKERGIAPKGKNSRKVWDEGTNSWTYLTGAHRSTSNPDDPQSWPIMEVGGNDDPYEDPWQKARDDKKDRIEKNIESRMRNEERAGNLTKGTTRRTMKAKKAAREAGRRGGDLDMQNFSNIPAGVPMDITKGKQRGMELTKKALLATQISTASLGKFDQMREGEPERKKAMNSGLKKRKFDSGTDSNIVKTEAKKSMKVLENVLTGGGKAKERAIRKGDFSKGTTAYDYDYDDGLSSSYKKKKGRAGMGKMKKITKKRAK